MTACADDQPTRKRGRLGPIPVFTGVPAMIGAVVLAVLLSGCQGPAAGSGPASSRAAAPSTSPAYRVTATVPIAKGPSETALGSPMVAVDPGTHTVYVIMTTGNSVSVIDGSTRTVTATVPVGKDPRQMVVDPGSHTVYVMNVEDGTVSVIDGSTRAVTATVPVGKHPNALAVDSSSHTVYVVNGVDNSVSVIDGSTRTVTATIPVGRHPDAVAVDPRTHTAYVTTDRAFSPDGQVEGGGAVSVIDGSTRTVTATVPIGERPDAVAVDPGTHTVYVRYFGAVDSDGRAVGNGTVSVIDASTGTVAATLPIGKFPGGMVVDQGTHSVFIANGNDDTVSVIDGSTRAVAATVPVGKDPEAVEVDPVTHTVYVTDNGGLAPGGGIEHGTVSVIDASTRAVTATVPVGYHPGAVAVDSSTHTVYVTNSLKSTVSVIESR